MSDPPPIPNSADTNPIPPPIEVCASFGGSKLGSLSWRAATEKKAILRAIKAAALPIINCKVVPSTRVATKAPDSDPITKPGANRQNSGTLTAPLWWWACKELIDVQMMVASAVPTASWGMNAASNPCMVKIHTKAETMTSPPPIPNKPAKNPAPTPVRAYMIKSNLSFPVVLLAP